MRTRKVVGAKHRGVKDLQKLKAEQVKRLKEKINNPPLNPDEQEIPKSVLEIMELKKEAKNNFERHKIKRKRKNKTLSVQQFLEKDSPQPGMKRPEKYIPNLVQKPFETPERFLSRVNSMTRKIIKESQFEEKYGVSIKKDMKTGKVLKVEKNKDEMKKSKKEKSEKKTLSQKRKERRLKKASENYVKDFSHLKDNVEFGEIVHKPPNLPSLKRKSNDESIGDKSKRYKNLLLQDLVGDN